METNGTVYLIHIDAKIAGHAQHYMGWAGNLKSRLGQHRRGTSRASKLMAEVKRLGLTWQLARTWEEEDRNFERKLKNRKNHRALCPVCNPARWSTNAPTQRGKSYAKKIRQKKEKPIPNVSTVSVELCEIFVLGTLHT
jgi:hypothetical protein